MEKMRKLCGSDSPEDVALVDEEAVGGENEKTVWL